MPDLARRAGAGDRTSADQPAAQAHRLSRSFRGVLAVDDLDLRVDAGQVHAIVGLNGAGKSTLMRLLAGLLRPDSGGAALWGVPAWNAPVGSRTRVGQVGGGRAYGELSVQENLRWSARLHGCGGREARRRSAELIEAFALGRWAARPARILSSGNRQRLALASALVHDPDLLILDEPTNALDPSGVIELRRIVAERARHGVAVLVSSHHLDEVARLASVITVMHTGRVIGTLSPEGIDLERQFFHLVSGVTTQAGP